MKMTADQNHCFSWFQWAIDLNIVFKHETIFTLINLTLWSILDTKIHAFDANLKATNDHPRFRAVLIMWSIGPFIQGKIRRVLRADVSKYRPEAYKSEKLKNPKKIHRVALVELVSEIYFLFRFDDYYWPRKIILVSGPPGRVFRVGTVSYEKNRFQN